MPTKLGLDALMKLSAVDYDLKNGKDRHTGLIAQDVEKVYPEAVSTNGDDGKIGLGPKVAPWGIDYGLLTPLLIQAIQDQQKEIEVLKKRIDAIEAAKTK